MSCMLSGSGPWMYSQTVAVAKNVGPLAGGRSHGLCDKPMVRLADSNLHILALAYHLGTHPLTFKSTGSRTAMINGDDRGA